MAVNGYCVSKILTRCVSNLYTKVCRVLLTIFLLTTVSLQSRYVPGAIESLQENLSWAGLQYDEGPSIPGSSKGPYIQSERLDLYRSYSERLISSGKAYRDFRPPSETSGKSQGRGKRIVDEYIPPDEDEARSLIRDGKTYVVRLKTLPQETRFRDLVFGEMAFGPDPSNDPILMKSDGWPTYHLANVVDDHEMGITHVLRGEVRLQIRQRSVWIG